MMTLPSLFKTDFLNDGKFLIYTSGNSMNNAGIADGDLLLIDICLFPKSGDIAVVDWNGALIVKRVFYSSRSIQLISDSFRDQYPTIEIDDKNEINFIAKVIAVMKFMPS